MTSFKKLTKQQAAVLAALAQCTVVGESQSRRRVCDDARLEGIEFHKAVEQLIVGELLKPGEVEDHLTITPSGWEKVQEWDEQLKKVLTRRGTEVDRELASRRSSNTVRGILAGAVILLIALTISAGYLGLELYMPALVTIVGLAVIGGTFAKMNRGIRQQNLKAIGITLIAVLVVILALENDGLAEAAIGLLSAIAGYLFGKDSSSDDEETDTSTNG